MTCLVIAYQNDKSATVSLLAYIALVYAFIADIVIFNLSFLAMELAGACIITFFNVLTIIYKMKYAPEDEDECRDTDKKNRTTIMYQDEELTPLAHRSSDDSDSETEAS